LKLLYARWDIPVPDVKNVLVSDVGIIPVLDVRIVPVQYLPL
jgi:hypothetical protein